MASKKQEASAKAGNNGRKTGSSKLKALKFLRSRVAELEVKEKEWT